METSHQMLVETFPVGALGCNCTILGDPATSQAIVIDPGDDYHEINRRLTKHKLKVISILHTHAHIDHVGATAQLQRATGASARIHEADHFLYNILGIQASFVGSAAPQPCELEDDLRDDTVVRVGEIELAVMHTPGHSPGSVGFVARTGDSVLLFSGDTLFRRGIGRTDLWGGDSNAIVRSIRDRLFSLEESTQVIPGHGEKTTIGEERVENPFIRAR